jgi:hypothetical protein
MLLIYGHLPLVMGPAEYCRNEEIFEFANLVKSMIRRHGCQKDGEYL